MGKVKQNSYSQDDSTCSLIENQIKDILPFKDTQLLCCFQTKNWNRKQSVLTYGSFSSPCAAASSSVILSTQDLHHAAALLLPCRARLQRVINHQTRKGINPRRMPCTCLPPFNFSDASCPFTSSARVGVLCLFCLYSHSRLLLI